MLARRNFLGNLLKTSAAVAFAPDVVSLAQANPSLSLRLASAEPTEIPANFTGLGYEMSSVASPGLLSAGNQRNVELIRGLGPEGVLRVGVPLRATHAMNPMEQLRPTTRIPSLTVRVSSSSLRFSGE